MEFYIKFNNIASIYLTYQVPNNYEMQNNTKQEIMEN